MEVPEKYLNRVVEGDCLKLLPELPDGCIDMILCDLPYGTTVLPWDNIIPLEPLWQQYERLLKPRGVAVLSAQGAFTAKLILSNERLFKYKIVWVKSSATNFLNGKKQPLRRHEDLCVFYREQPTYHPQLRRGSVQVRKPKSINSDSQGNIKPLPEATRSRDRYPYDVVFYEEEPIVDSLFFKNAAAEGKTNHPTQKPLGLGRYLVRTYSNPGDVVLDNACGSGTFAVSAVMEHRQFIAMEKNEQSVHLGEPVNYIQTANERIEKAYRWRQDEDKKLSLF